MQRVIKSLEAILLVFGLVVFIMLVYRSAGQAESRRHPYQVSSPVIAFRASAYLNVQNSAAAPTLPVMPIQTPAAQRSLSPKATSDTHRTREYKLEAKHDDDDDQNTFDSARTQQLLGEVDSVVSGALLRLGL